MVTITCGHNLSSDDEVGHKNLGIFSHATDGAFAYLPILLAIGINITVETDLLITELAEARKDVVLVVTHGLCVVNGATSTIIKKG